MIPDHHQCARGAWAFRYSNSPLALPPRLTLDLVAFLTMDSDDELDDAEVEPALEVIDEADYNHYVRVDS